MCDDYSAYYKAFSKVISRPEHERLSKRHMHRRWRMTIRKYLIRSSRRPPQITQRNIYWTRKNINCSWLSSTWRRQRRRGCAPSAHRSSQTKPDNDDLRSCCASEGIPTVSSTMSCSLATTRRWPTFTNNNLKSCPRISRRCVRGMAEYNSSTTTPYQILQGWPTGATRADMGSSAHIQHTRLTLHQPTITWSLRWEVQETDMQTHLYFLPGIAISISWTAIFASPFTKCIPHDQTVIP